MANHPRLVPRPLPIDESRLERRDHTNIQSHRPNRSTLDRSLSRDRSVARARASVVASVVARDDATEETMGGYDIPKAFSFVVTARARRSHRPASSIARPPRAPIVSPSRALARSRRPSRDASRGTTTTVDRREKNTVRTWTLVALKAATRPTKEEARRADIVLVCRNDERNARAVGVGSDRVSDRPRPTDRVSDRPRPTDRVSDRPR